MKDKIPSYDYTKNFKLACRHSYRIAKQWGINMESKPVEREPILWTERVYPCGCSAKGPGDIPPYCEEHGFPVAVTNLSPDDYDDLVRDAMSWRRFSSYEKDRIG